MVQRALAPVQFRPPMECRPVAELPTGELWQYELKFDGYRAQAIKSEGEVHLFSRRGKAFDAIYPQVVAHLAAVRGVKQFVLDGELVAIDEEGRHSFELMQRIRSKPARVLFYLFDILHLDGKELVRQILSRRRAILEREFPDRQKSCIRLSPILKGSPRTILENVHQFGFEGVVAKRTDSFYVPGEEPGTWVKHKTQPSEDFLVGGYIPNGRAVGELLVGRMEEGKLLFVASVKNGFVPATRQQVFRAIANLKIQDCPFSNLPEKKGPHRMDQHKMQRVEWVKPQVVTEIAFNEVTSSGNLRHSKFLRLREDSDLRG
jgi:bifunctional non-homologous end joining protein LigD